MKKTSALALAIAGTMAAPAVMAESGFYMSARMGLQMAGSDNDAAESFQFEDLASRMGWRMETDLGNGKTAYGKYEVRMNRLVNATNSGGNTDAGRDFYVGLKGDFGDIKVAQRGYAAYYNHVSSAVDIPYWATPTGIGDGNSRSDQFIGYSGGTDAFSFEVDVEADGTDATEPGGNSTSTTGYQVGATIGLGDWNLGLGMRNAEDSTVRPTAKTVSGVSFSGNLGDIGLAVSFNTDDNGDGAQLYGSFGNFWAEYGQQNVDATDRTPTSISVGYSAALGRNTSWWAEYGTYDSDGGVDSDVLAVALRYDWN